MATILPIKTAEQLWASPDLGPCELVRGQLVMMSPAGFEHGRVVGRLHVFLANYVNASGLGVVTGARTGFVIERDPDTVRAADVAFVRSERVPAEDAVGFFDGAPDLAVEVISPGDRTSEVASKVEMWLACGCQAVWVVEPGPRNATVHTPRGAERLASADFLKADDLLPGLSVAVSDVFAR